MRRKFSLAAFAVFLALALGACETDPATDVRPQQATLNAKGRCYTGLNGWSRFQIRDVTTGGTFFGVADRYVYNCGGDTQTVQFEPKTVGGLTPGHLYEFRLRTELSNGEQFWTDSVGTQGGTNYDRFRAPEWYQWEMVCLENPSRAGCEGAGTTSGEDDADHTIECEDGAIVCGSAKQRQCKGKGGNPLNHFMSRTSHYVRAYEAESRFSWCWKDGKIVLARVDASRECQTTNWGWANGWWFEECKFVNGKETACGERSCLFHHRVVARCCREPITGKLPVLPFKRVHCLGTRVCAYKCSDDGRAYHSRNPDHDRDC